MKIIKKNIKDLSENFRDFFDTFDGLNYVISANVIKFNFDEDENFNLEIMKELILNLGYPYNIKVHGTVKQITSEFLKEKIEDCFSDTSSADGYISKIQDKEVLNKRIKYFWNLVEKYFFIPPNKIYSHETFSGCFFDLGCIWRFCFILLNDNNEGILIAAGASD